MNIPEKISLRLLCLLSTAVLAIPHTLHGREPAKLDLVTPFPGTVAISKAPLVSFRSSEQLLEDGLLVMLDGNDFTALVTEENGLYRFTPLNPLEAGDHTLYVIAYTADGTPVEKEFVFSSRHSESFEEIYSDNRLSATLKGVLNREFSSADEGSASGGLSTDFPYASFDSYLSSESGLKEGEWDSTLQTNVRYYDQNASMTGGSAGGTSLQSQSPGKKYLSLLGFLISANYTAERYSAHAEIGDTTIEESKNTVDYLTRRGGRASITVGTVTLGGFGVLGKETGYEIDGLGFGFNANDHIMGTSAKMDLFDQQMSIKAIYARGGEDGTYQGTWSEVEGRKGDVTGLVWTSDFFEQKMMTDIEFDVVNFDVDAGDEEEETISDKAYRIRIHGLSEASDYELSYRYTGPQYEVVGNQSIVKDWAGFGFNGGTSLTEHGLRLLLNYSWDNVEDEDIYARIYSFTSGFEYRYSGWERFPVSLLLEHNRQRSTDEPEEFDPTALDTTTLTGSLGFVEGPWAVEIRSSYSEQNDKSLNDYDTQLISVTVVPSYTGAFFSILPSWTLTSSKDLNSGVRTDTNTMTLDVYSSFFADLLTCELGGTYDWTTTDDDSVDLNNAMLYGRLNYHLEPWWRLKDSTIALEYNYTRQEDMIYDTTVYEGVLALVLSSAIPYSF